jgi:hypothetical protein
MPAPIIMFIALIGVFNLWQATVSYKEYIQWKRKAAQGLPVTYKPFRVIAIFQFVFGVGITSYALIIMP